MATTKKIGKPKKLAKVKPPVEVIGYTHDVDLNVVEANIRATNYDGVQTEFTVPRIWLKNKNKMLESKLDALGVNGYAEHMEFLKAAHTIDPKKITRVVSTPGWRPQSKRFAWPGRTLHENGQDLIFRSGAEHEVFKSYAC